jgi:hypothetical protein
MPTAIIAEKRSAPRALFREFVHLSAEKPTSYTSANTRDRVVRIAKSNYARISRLSALDEHPGFHASTKKALVQSICRPCSASQ